MHVPVPELAPLDAPQTDAERRERQRLHVKRAYYRRLNMMQELRSQVRALEDHFAELVVQKQAAEQRHSFDPPMLEADTSSAMDAVVSDSFLRTDETDFNVFATSNAVAAPGTGLESLRELYTEISQVKEQLQAQNEALRVTLDEFERSALRMRALAEMEELEEASSDETQEPRTKLKQPVTLEFCQSITFARYQEVLAFRETQHGFVTTGVSAFGWRDKRLQYGDRVKFSLSKQFDGVSPLDMWLRGWKLVSSPTSLAALFSPSTNTKIWTMQQVDEDNCVLYREMSSPDGAIVIKTPVLATRFTTPTGFIVMVHSLSPSLVEATVNPPGVVEKWIEHYSWITFEAPEDGSDHDCVVEYSGDVQSNPLVSTGLWMVELLCIILRWDAAVVGPIFSLC